MPSQFNKEKAAQNIASILEKIKTEADPHLLNEYRAVLKKEVSLFRRSWVSAYLLMLFDQGALGRGFVSRFRGAGEERPRSAEGKTADTQRFPLAEEDSARLFMSIGRNRRVFPREILGLITTKTSVPREDVGAIRILDNYSFVQVRNTAAETIIKALNGCSFRGRTLGVNYAKLRKDESPSGDMAEERKAEEDENDEYRESSMPDDYAPDAEDSEQADYNSDKEDI